VSAGTYNWLLLTPHVDPPDDEFWAYCIEPTVWTQSDETYFEVHHLDQILDDPVAGYIEELWVEKILGDPDGPAPPVFDPTAASDAFYAAAFQLTIWEFVDEDPANGYGIGYQEGDFWLMGAEDWATKNALRNTVNQWIADTLDAETDDVDLWGLINDNTQDQSVLGGSHQVVPLPAAAWGGMMLLGGMAAVVGMRRKLRPR